MQQRPLPGTPVSANIRSEPTMPMIRAYLRGFTPVGTAILADLRVDRLRAAAFWNREGREPLWRASNWYSTSSTIKPARFPYGQQPDKSPPEIGGPGRLRIICDFSTGKLKFGL